MTVEIIDCEQSTEAWYRARMGIPTASEFSTVLMVGKNGGDSVMRKKYLRKLAGELITGEPSEQYSNPYMDRGKAMEAEARACYSLVSGYRCKRVGFVRNGNKGCSPDSLIGEDGMLEIKTAAPHVLIEIIEGDKIPPEHVAQCQGGLWVCEREWIDLSVYWPRMPEFRRRAYRDEPYIRKLSDAVDRFNDELAALVERIKQFGSSRLAA